MTYKILNEIIDLIDVLHNNGVCIGNSNTLGLDSTYLKEQSYEIRTIIIEKLKHV